MANVGNPLVTSYTRIFYIDSGVRPDHAPEYQSCTRAGGASQSGGDVNRIQCPSPDQFNKFITVGEYQGAEDRGTVQIISRYMAELRSEMLRMMKKRCRVDVFLLIGECTDPTDYDEFTKILAFDDARWTNWSTDDLGALESGETNPVNETGDLSADDIFEIGRLTWAKRADDIITNKIVDVIFGSKPSCGDCDDEDSGCDKIYAVSLSQGGSLLTPADVVYSLDGGENWNTSEVDSLAFNENPNALAKVGADIVVVSEDSCSLHYVAQSDLDAVGDETWQEVTTGFVAGGCPRDIWSVGTYAFICGAGGYVYGLTDAASGVTVLDAGVATTQQLNAIHALDKNFAVAVGANGAIVMTENQTIWTEVTTSPTGANLSAVWLHNEDVWEIATTTGRVYYTLDKGVTWTEKGFAGSGAGVCYDIAYSNDWVGYLAHTTSTPRGRIFRTHTGGYSWRVMPRGTGTLPLNDAIVALAACPHDPNVVVGVGLADNGTDGYIVLGKWE